MGINVVRPGEGEKAGGGPLKVRIIEDGAHTEHRLGLIEGTVPAEVSRGRFFFSCLF